MRLLNTKGPASVGPLSRMSVGLGVSSFNILPFPTLETAKANVQIPMAVGNTALAVEEVLEELPEPDEGSVQRPLGVSDQVLLEAWHRLHTPYASVAGQKNKKSGVTRRVHHSISGTHRPKAYMPKAGGVVGISGVNVLTMAETIGRISGSLSTRYLREDSTPKDFINPKAEAYVLARWKEKVDVWKPVVQMYQAAADKASQAYDFGQQLEYRRLERDDIPFDLGVEQEESKYTYLPKGFVGPVMPAANDASVIAVPYVGPATSLACREDVPVRSWDSFNSTRAFYYSKRKKELEQAFAKHSYKQNTTASKYTLPEQMLPTHDDVPDRSYLAYQRTRDFKHGVLQAMYEELWRQLDKELLNTAFLAKQCKMFKRNNWNASPDFTRKLRANLNQFVSQPSRASLQLMRAQAYRYKLRGIANKNSSVSAYQSMSFVQFIKLYKDGHDLPQAPSLGKSLTKSETKWSSAALSRVYSKVVAMADEAKAAIKQQARGAKKIIFGGEEFTETEAGLFLPTVGLALPLEPGW